MAYKLEEMSVYLKARDFSVAVTSIIDRPAFGRNRRLKDQIADANDSILSNMAEGFEQPRTHRSPTTCLSPRARSPRSWHA
jgi:four helix bundle protein